MQVMNNDAQLAKDAAKVICSFLCHMPTTCVFAVEGVRWMIHSPLLSALIMRRI